MPLLVKCPLCRGVMPHARGESRCPRCGELVLPAVRKLCAICSVDVTYTKRVRDEVGEYFCHDCWAARLAARGEEPGYQCNTCGEVFPSRQVYQLRDGDELICHACYADRNLDPDAPLAAAAQMEPSTPSWPTTTSFAYSGTSAAAEADAFGSDTREPIEPRAPADMPYLHLPVRKRETFPWGIVVAMIAVMAAMAAAVLYGLYSDG